MMMWMFFAFENTIDPSYTWLGNKIQKRDEGFSLENWFSFSLKSLMIIWRAYEGYSLKILFSFSLKSLRIIWRNHICCFLSRELKPSLRDYVFGIRVFYVLFLSKVEALSHFEENFNFDNLVVLLQWIEQSVSALK